MVWIQSWLKKPLYGTGGMILHSIEVSPVSVSFHRATLLGPPETLEYLYRNWNKHTMIEKSKKMFKFCIKIIVGKKMSTDSSESIQSHKHTQALILVPYLFQCLFPVPHISSIKQYTFTMCNVHACEVWITYCCRPIISEAPVMACGGKPPLLWPV